MNHDVGEFDFVSDSIHVSNFVQLSRDTDLNDNLDLNLSLGIDHGPVMMDQSADNFFIDMSRSRRRNTFTLFGTELISSPLNEPILIDFFDNHVHEETHVRNIFDNHVHDETHGINIFDNHVDYSIPEFVLDDMDEFYVEVLDRVDGGDMDFEQARQLLSQFDEDEDDDVLPYGELPVSKDVIDNLPDVALTREEAANGNAICAICMDDMKVAKQLPCLHRYHGHCIEPWLCKQNTCPMCRFKLPTGDVTSMFDGD